MDGNLWKDMWIIKELKIESRAKGGQERKK